MIHVIAKKSGGRSSTNIKSPSSHILVNMLKPTVMAVILLSAIKKHLKHVYPAISPMTCIKTPMARIVRNVIPPVAGKNSISIMPKTPTSLYVVGIKSLIVIVAIRKIPIRSR